HPRRPAPGGAPPRDRAGRRRPRLHPGPLRPRPEEPDAPAASPRRFRARRETRRHRAAAQAHARRRAIRTTDRSPVPRMTARNLTLFDLDGTLIAGDSDHSFGEFMVAIGWADGDAWRQRNDEFYATYVAGALDVHAYVAFATSV